MQFYFYFLFKLNKALKFNQNQAYDWLDWKSLLAIILSPKNSLWFFWQNLTILDMVGKIVFFKKINVKIDTSN
jgi:hypothetical protein